MAIMLPVAFREGGTDGEESVKGCVFAVFLEVEDHIRPGLES